MRSTAITKIEEGRYNLTSLPCPQCSTSLVVEITGHELFRINQGESNVLSPRLSPEERERFISGYCPACWVKVFGEDEDEDACEGCGKDDTTGCDCEEN